MENVFNIRTPEDANRVVKLATSKNVVIVGASFLGELLLCMGLERPIANCKSSKRTVSKNSHRRKTYCRSFPKHQNWSTKIPKEEKMLRSQGLFSPSRSLLLKHSQPRGMFLSSFIPRSITKWFLWHAGTLLGPFASFDP